MGVCGGEQRLSSLVFVGLCWRSWGQDKVKTDESCLAVLPTNRTSHSLACVIRMKTRGFDRHEIEASVQERVYKAWERWKRGRASAR